MAKNIITGVKKSYYAIEKSNGVYDEVKELCELIEVGVIPKEEMSPCHAGNRIYHLESGLSDIDVTFTVPGLSTEQIKDLFGLTEATEGGLIYKNGAKKPDIAIMFEKTLSDGVLEYVTLFRGKLNLADDKGKTQEGKTDYQVKQFAGKFSTLENGIWMHVVRSSDVGFNAETWATKWGKQVVIPTDKVVVPAK